MPKQLLYKGLTAPQKAAPRRQVKVAPEGIVEAIVAVTGVTDAVEDLIVPGAFAASLAVRRPKVVDDHEWKNKVGRVLHVEEWMPGDPRLPKRTKDGKPWPAEAGALVATMQYNLNAERGREAYEWVRFYAESNEAEFSIGYKVPDGKARLRRDGVRVILMVDLFEFSHVLFGAAPLSMALSVKAMHSGSGGSVELPAPLTPEEEDDEEEDYEHVDTHPEKPWDTEDLDDQYARPRRGAYFGRKALDAVMQAKSAGGNAEQLREYWAHGEGAAKIGWGTPGDFNRCVSLVTEHMGVEDAKGYCNLRHHDALGIYPATHAKMEGKAHQGKAMGRMKGSYEERIAVLEQSARNLLAGALNVEQESLVVAAVATYGHEAVVRAYGPGIDGDSYLIGYTADPTSGDVELAEPQKVELSLVAEADDDVPQMVDDETAEEITIQPMLGALDLAEGIMRMGEGKTYKFIESRLRQMGVSTKSADDDQEAVAPGRAVADEDTITRDKLPDGEWAEFEKVGTIQAMQMGRPFTVQTREGVIDGQDGDWLALDSGDYPYPIAADEFESVYQSVANDTELEDEEPADDEGYDVDDTQDLEPADDQDLDPMPDDAGAPTEDPAPDAAPPADEDTVTIDPDEHFATLDALDSDDPEDDEDTTQAA